jgi:trimethylamine--corrinoid protein Co-methyltransferase
MSGGTITSPAHLALRVLSDDDVRSLHAAALASLADEAAAAEDAAARAPRAAVLAAREPGCDVLADGGRSWLAAGGLTPARAQSHEGLAGTPHDLRELCRLADALPEVALVMTPPLEVPGLAPLPAAQLCLESTRKHLCLTTLRDAAEAEVAVRMAEALAGGPDAVRARPPLSLVAPAGGLEAALVFARAGLPVGLVLAAGADPADDVAGALVRHHAGVLRACLAVQREAEGAAFLYVVPPAPPAAADAVLFALGAAQLAAHVCLPLVIAALSTSAADGDWASCADNALSSMAVMATTGAVVAGAGMLADGAVFSPSQLVMDAELFSWNARLAAGVELNEDTLAVDVVKLVGVGGNFLGQRHTRRHMRSVWRPRLLDRTPWDAWVAAGSEGSPELARALVDQLLATHQIPRLDPELSATLSRLTGAAGPQEPDLPLTRGVVE